MEKNDEKRYAIIEEVEIAENGEIVTPTVLTTVYQIKESSLKIILTPINVHIVTSFQITDRKDKEEVLDYILKVAKEYGLLVELFESGASFHYEDISKPTMIYDGQVEFRDYIDIHISTFSKQESTKVVDIISKYKGLDVVTYEEAR